MKLDGICYVQRANKSPLPRKISSEWLSSLRSMHSTLLPVLVGLLAMVPVRLISLALRGNLRTDIHESICS